MRKKFSIVLLLFAFVLSVFSGCAKKTDDTSAGNSATASPTPTDVAAVSPDTGTADTFNVPDWMAVTAHAMQFNYIDVSAPPDGHITASQEQHDKILSELSDVSFDLTDAVTDMTTDFAFAMNEPFMFFGFTDTGLLVKEPTDDGTGYLYYLALFTDYPQLNDLKDYIGEMRTNYSAAE